ncbi:MAG: CHAT domain-containing protein, partial [Ilumatobacteraceae bacterium]
FDLTVGLSPTPVSGVVGPALIRPPSSVGDYELTAHVVADGFELAPGETCRKTMLVSAAQPSPYVVFHLLAPAEADPSHVREINVLYSVQSQTMGLGIRPVRIVGSRAELSDADLLPPPAAAGSLGVPVADQPPDLTVRILRGSAAGRLLWSFESPHATFDEGGTTSIGDDPDAFARTVISTIAAHEGRPTLALGLHGIGLTISAKVPDEMWAALTSVCAAVAPKRPTVLVLSEEAYIPWELATMPVPLDPSIIGFLGAQVVIGRWVLATSRPPLPPPRLVHVEDMVVISGRYEQPGWSRLEHAEAEAATLVERYHAVGVDAVTDKVVGCLLGDPAADVLHFSLHGKYDPGSAKQGLVLVDGDVIDPLVVKGGSLAKAPLVFLNACQVGTGQETLGDYAGLAESFLFAGASAVVAPLWSINDAAARALAERFYSRAFAGETVAEIVRAERAAFGKGDEPNSSTLVAFQFFGHPEMRLEMESSAGT